MKSLLPNSNHPSNKFGKNFISRLKHDTNIGSSSFIRSQHDHLEVANSSSENMIKLTRIDRNEPDEESTCVILRKSVFEAMTARRVRCY